MSKNGDNRVNPAQNGLAEQVKPRSIEQKHGVGDLLRAAAEEAEANRRFVQAALPVLNYLAGRIGGFSQALDLRAKLPDGRALEDAIADLIAMEAVPDAVAASLNFGIPAPRAGRGPEPQAKPARFGQSFERSCSACGRSMEKVREGVSQCVTPSCRMYGRAQ